MAYVVVADFRTATVAEYCKGLELTTTEAADALLTAAITRLSARFDDWTNDKFEAEAAQTNDLDGTGRTRLYLPKRIRTLTSVSLIATGGTVTAQDAADYRLTKSLNSAGTDTVGEYDYIEIIKGRLLTDGSAEWPAGTRNVRVVADLSWASTPDDVKRAVALLVYDHFKPLNPYIRRAESYSTADASIRFVPAEPSGITEVDEIVALRLRPDPPVF